MKFIKALLVASTLSGCATLMNGPTQSINVQTEPPGAICSLGADKITTPGYFIIHRKDWQSSLDVTCDHNGYETARIKLASSTSGYIWGNLLIGIIPGLIIDTSSGAAATLSPNKIQIDLVRKQQG